MAFAEEKIDIQFLRGKLLAYAEKKTYKIHTNYQMIYKSNNFKTESIMCLLFPIAINDGK